MDSRDTFRRPISGIGDPVYSTPNPSSLSSSSSSSPTRSSHLTSPLPSSKSVTFAIPSTTQVATTPQALNLTVDTLKKLNVNWSILAAVAQNVSPSTLSTSTNSSSDPSFLAVLNNPTVISQRLSELLRQEEEIAFRRNNLETELAEIRSREKDLSQQRSQLIRQLDRVVSPQSSVSPQALASPSVNSSPIRSVLPGETTTIESIPDSDSTQPRSSDLNASTPSMARKRPGPASKTIPGLKQINPGSLPSLRPTSNSSKKLRKDGDDSTKRPVTTGVKQSRPQPIRARKRTKPNETDSITESQSNIISQDQAGKDQQPPQSQPQLKQKAPTPVQKNQPSSTKSIITKEDVKPSIKEEKHKNSSSNFKNLDLTCKPNPFKERVETSEQISPKVKIKQEPGTEPNNQMTDVVIARYDNTGPMRPNPACGDSDDDAHSDSDIFGALGSLQSNEVGPENVANDGLVKKIKKEPESPKNKQEPEIPIIKKEPEEPTCTQEYVQEAARLGTKIKKEK